MIIPPTLHALTAGPDAPHDRQQASQNHRHRHGFRPHTQHRAFPNGVEQVVLACQTLFNPRGPCLLQVQEHDDPKFGRHACKRDEPNHTRDGKIVSEAVKKPDAADQCERQSGHQ